MKTPVTIAALTITVAGITLSVLGNHPVASPTTGHVADISTRITADPAADGTPSGDLPAGNSAAGNSVTGDPAESGVLKGQLYVTGGVYPGVKRLRAGQVLVTGSNFRREITVGQDGAYAINVPAGTYTVAGIDPRLAPGPIVAKADVAVAKGATVTVDVYLSVP